MSGRITIDGLSDSLKEYLNTLGLNESQVQQLIDRFEDEKIGDLSTLTTENKTVVAAINELFQSANNGKELIATAIGEPLTAEDTFSAMSSGINGLTTSFKSALMNNGVSVTSTDKFKQLIEKIALLADSEGKGIRYAEGDLSNATNVTNTKVFKVTDLGFTPSIVIFMNTNTLNGNTNSCMVYTSTYSYSGYRNSSKYNSSVTDGFSDPGDGYYHAGIYILENGFEIKTDSIEVQNINKWYAIGVGEEDTTLLDSLKSILQDEGVVVTEEDDMASLIVKTDNEFTNKNNEIASNKQALVDALKSNGRDLSGNESIDELIELVKINGIVLSPNNVKSIATRSAYSFVLKNDGNVWATGLNYGQLGLGHTTDIKLFNYVLTNNVKEISCGNTHSFILKNDGTVWSCGNNNYGQLGTGAPSNNATSTFTQVNITDVKQIACGNGYTFILKNDGSLWAVGYNANGELGLSSTTNQTKLTQVNVNINNDVKEVICNNDTTFIIKNDGTVWGTGKNGYGQLGLGDTTRKTVFTQLNVTDVKSVYCGYEYTFIIKNDGTVWSCGYNNGQLGLGDNVAHYTFSQVSIDNVKEIACGTKHALILKNDGTLWACGNNQKGQLGLGNQTNNNVFTKVNINNVKQVGAGSLHSLLLKNDGTVWACGNQGGQTGIPIGSEDIITSFTQTYKKIVTEVTFD